MTTEQASAYYGAQREAMATQEAQRQQAGIVSQSAQANVAGASWAQQQAENRAMRAENGAGPVGSQSWRSARLARQDAEGMGRTTAAAQTAFGNANAGVGIINPVQDFMNRQKGIASAAGVPGELAQQTAATAKTQASTEGEKLDVANKQEMHQLGQSLMTMPPGPERDAAMQNYALRSGMKGDIHVGGGGQALSPSTGLPYTLPQVVVYTPPGGQPRIIHTQGEAPPAAAAQYNDGEKRTMNGITKQYDAKTQSWNQV
jgi:hypothetical protein